MTGTADGYVKIYDTQTCALKSTFDVLEPRARKSVTTAHVDNIAVSPDGTRMVVSCSDQVTTEKARLFEWSTGRKVAGFASSLPNLHFSSDSRYMVSGVRGAG